ncbi:hypothetical protein [Capnocytophaga sp.]|uniref:hypothetical protein n=1 Tax=Capnocytophaga sp. TaxID=44737 RepID=UPI0026DD18D0|nr:hypothetical protein [Capnocytophaga sp.]MDO5104577.1 hypothetical protein [Capnocytophaga sp.]
MEYFCNEFGGMNRIVIGILLLLLGLSACGRKGKSVKGDVLLFPENTQVIYRINNKDNFLSSIENNEFWKENNPKPLRPYETKLLRSLPTENNIWVAFTAYKNFFAICKKESSDTLSLWKNANATIQKQTQFGRDWYYTVVDNRLIVSNSSEINTFFEVETDSLKKTENQLILKRLQSIATTACNANLFMQKEQAKQFFTPFFKNDVTKPFKHWVALDLFLEENDVRFSGMAVAQTSDSQTDLLLRTEPYEKNLAQIVPAHILAMTAFTFEDAKHIALPDSVNVPFQKTLNGIAFAQTIDGQFAVASSFDVDETLLKLPILSEDAQSHFPLYELNNDSSLDFFKFFEPNFKPKYVSIHDEYLIFTKTKETVTSVMDDIRRKNTLLTNKSYKLLDKNIASNASLTRVANLQSNNDFGKKYPKIAENYRWAVFQQTPQDEYYMLNFVSRKQTQSTSADRQSKERFAFVPDANIITAPTILLNHRTKRREIALQDENYDLYLIGNNGSLLWKKKLDGKIQSPIYQVDLFKNGFLQMAFTTEHSIWIIDRNGNNVTPFPKKYNGKITPLEVFDYDRNLEYRFLFAEGKNLRMLDRKGDVVGGFSRKNTDSAPLFTPKHYRAGEKDFLVYISDNGKFNILHRNGEIRIPIQGKYDFSNNPPLFFDNRFLFSTRDGNLIRIDLNGKITVNERKWDRNHFLIGNQHTTSFLSGTTLSIGSMRIEIPDGKYPKQKLFRIRGVNYVAATDIRQGKAYLWNEQGKLVQHFPIEGVTQMDIDVDLDKSVWVAVAKSKRELCVYEMNDLK